MLQSEPNGIASLKITVPDFKPLSEETRACFEHKSPCRLQAFDVNNGVLDGDTIINRLISNHEVPYRHKITTLGYDLYTIGPGNARIENYIKHVDGRTILF